MSNRDGRNAEKDRRNREPCWHCDGDKSCPHTNAANQRRMQTTIAESADMIERGEHDTKEDGDATE